MIYCLLLLLTLSNLSYACCMGASRVKKLSPTSGATSTQPRSAQGPKSKPSKPTQKAEEPPMCCVCQENMPNLRVEIPKQSLEELQYTLPCRHTTHFKCAANLQLQAKDKCPLCSKQFVLQVVPLSSLAELRTANQLNDKQLAEEKQRDDALAQDHDERLSAQRVLQETNALLLEQLTDIASQLHRSQEESKVLCDQLETSSRELNAMEEDRDQLQAEVEQLQPIKDATYELVLDKTRKGIGILRALQAALESNPQP
jgi:hypothetical protein